MKDFLDAVGYKIGGSSEFCWTCYGDNAHRIEYWDGDAEGVSAEVIFDTLTQVVYEVSSIDYGVNLAYRWINPDFRTAVEQDAIEREVDLNAATDTAQFVDLDDKEEMMMKIREMIHNAQILK